MKRLFVVLLLLFSISVPLVNFWQRADVGAFRKELLLLPDSVVLQKKDTVLIVAVGDVQLGTIYPDMKGLPSLEQCNAFFSEVAGALSGGDVTFCNLEGCFADTSMMVRKFLNKANSHRFGMPREYAGALTNAGFNLVSVANNHSLDFSAPGVRLTREVLDSVGVNWAGYLSHPYAVFEKDSVKYGFCAFSPNAGVTNLGVWSKAEEIIRHLKEEEMCDIVIVSMHPGAEGSQCQHVKDFTEYYLHLYRGNSVRFAHKAIDAGADLVLGHGPHVLRALELYNGKLIVYSMGNFATYSDISVQGVCGVAGIFRIKYCVPTHSFVSADVVPTYQAKPHRPGPHVDSTRRRAISILRDLSCEDFPETCPSISEMGHVTPQ